MSHEPDLKEIQKEWHGTLHHYVWGFLASLLLTFAAYFLVITKALEGLPLIITVITLGLVQAVVQLFLFLHLGKESKPRWETMMFLFMVLVLLIIVLGSLWIMFDLDSRMMGGMID